jgi:MoaA/NifB/PqqE/SkfB family radical SAM enzyme
MKEFYVQWHITEICNFDCLHCYKEPYREELSFDSLKIVADKLEKISEEKNCKFTISITGGEPFLKPEVYDLAEYLDRKNFVEKLNFITNGSIIPEKRVKNLSKLSTIYISLESIEPKINDKIRGDESTNLVFENLEYFVKNFNVGIMTTLMNSNINDLIENLDKFVEKLFFLGVKEIIFERFVPVGKAKKLKNEVVEKEKIFDFYLKISNIFCVNFEMLKFYPAVKIVNIEGMKEIFGAECIFGKDGFAILCDGTVYPCRRFDFSIGNLLDKNFSLDILEGLRLKFHPKKDIFCCYAMDKSSS